MIAGHWIAIMEGSSLKERTYNHVAFRVEPHAFDSCVERVKHLGLDVLPGRSRVDGESLRILGSLFFTARGKPRGIFYLGGLNYCYFN